MGDDPELIKLLSVLGVGAVIALLLGAFAAVVIGIGNACRRAASGRRVCPHCGKDL